MKTSVDRYICVAKNVSTVQLKCPTNSEMVVYVVSWMQVLLNCSTQQVGYMLCWATKPRLLHHICPKPFGCICFPKQSSFWKDSYSCGPLPGLISPLRIWECISVYCRTQLEPRSILELSVAVYSYARCSRKERGKTLFFVRWEKGRNCFQLWVGLWRAALLFFSPLAVVIHFSLKTTWEQHTFITASFPCSACSYTIVLQNSLWGAVHPALSIKAVSCNGKYRDSTTAIQFSHFWRLGRCHKNLSAIQSVLQRSADERVNQTVTHTQRQ